MAIATLALNPLGAAEKAAGEGFSYALGAPAAVKSISNLTKLGAQAANGATEIGAGGALAATKAVGGQLAKAAAAGLIFEGAVRPAFEGAVSVAANTLGIHTDAPQPPTVTSLLQSAALSVLLAGHGIEFKDIPASQVTSAMVRGKVREDLGIPLDSTDPQRIAQVTSYLQSKGVPIDPSNAQALTAPLSAGEQHLYSDLSAKIDAMKAAGKFDGKTGDFVPATQATVPGASGENATTLSGGVAAVDKAGGGGGAAPTSLPGSSPPLALDVPKQPTVADAPKLPLVLGNEADRPSEGTSGPPPSNTPYAAFPPGSDGGNTAVRSAEGLTSATEAPDVTSGAGQASRPGSNRGRNTTRLGVKRNNRADWRATVDLWDQSGYGHLLSAANRASIAAGRTPVVHNAWIAGFPEDAGLKGEQIPMHHFRGLPLTIPLPYPRHLDAHMPGGFRRNSGSVGSALPIYPPSPHLPDP